MFSQETPTYPFQLNLGEWVNAALELESIDDRLKLVVRDCSAKANLTDPASPTKALLNNKSVLSSICVCMYVPMCACMCACIHVFMCLCVFMCVCVCSCVCVCVYVSMLSALATVHQEKTILSTFQST